VSEYQYYEFQAVDRPLTKDEMAELRKLTTRATITANRLQNVYHFGDFRGDPDRLMEQYFDAHVYVANWGTHRFMLRLPSSLLDLTTAERYAWEDSLQARRAGEFVILEFLSDAEESAWIDDEEAEGWMPSLLPIRSDLARGDLRALYLGWLAGAQVDAIDDGGEDEWEEDDEAEEWDDGEDDADGLEGAEGTLAPGFDDSAVEPPVPPGLGALSASLQALVEFLRLDPDLIAVAAKNSPVLRDDRPLHADLERWIAELPGAEKDLLLLRLVRDRDSRVADELYQRFRRSQRSERAANSALEPKRRTIGDLLGAAKVHAAERRRAEAEQEAQERARQEHEAAIARAKHLDRLVGREEDLWRQVESLIDQKQATPYDQAVEHLKDLRDLAARANQTSAFTFRLQELRERHAKKTAFQQRLDAAKLGSR
jgi:hypothetical protein